ncbi:MAG: hypothetical protein K8S00_12125 [Bacteroidales bacterium]|nr:hypothetical protein [Bacteroidales bacterium]
MADVLYNKEGTPLMAYGKTFLMSTTGFADSPVTNPKPPDDESLEVDGKKISPWGEDNNLPTLALTTIGKTPVLNTALKFNMKIILGQGIFPVKVTGFDADGNETIEVVNDSKLTTFISSRMIRRYLQTSLRDILKFGSCFPELIFSKDYKSIVGLNTINAAYCRYLEMEKGVINNVITSGRFPDLPQAKSEYKIIPCLNSFDPAAEIESISTTLKKKTTSCIFPLNDPWSNDIYYPLPDWWTAKQAGWIDVANKVPLFLQKMYENQISWRWHVKIPYSYWIKRYPLNEYKDKVKRQQLINEDMNKIEQNLAGAENASKAIFSMFEINPQGKAEEQWVIEPLDNKYKADDKLITSAAANSEILFSLMVNPSVLGAGMPGGPYSGNAGSGSDIREAFLVNVAMSWIDRQNILEPIEAILAFNGYKDIELRFRNTILTTLDTGAGTEKIIS